MTRSPFSSGALHRLASLMFFASGFAALMYEAVWFKRFTHVWGSSSTAQAAVVAAFLLGLSLGAWLIGRRADRLKSPLIAFSVLELAIAAWALLVPFGMNALIAIQPAIYPLLQDSPVLLFAARASLTFLLIGPACMMMGGTLPLMMKWFASTPGWPREITGWLYAVNTLGAAAGVYAAGFHFLPAFGIVATNTAAAGLDALVGLSAIAIHRWQRSLQSNENDSQSDENSGETLSHSFENELRPRMAYPAALLAGCASLVLQLVWTRHLATTLGGATYAFSAMLAVFLLGIGLGGYAYNRWRSREKAALALALAVCALAAFTALGLSLLPRLAELAGTLRPLRAAPSLNALVCMSVSAVLQFIPTVCMGFLFPFLIDAAGWRRRNVGGVAGGVSAWNTAGCLLGALMTPIAFIAALGTAASAAFAISLYGIATLLLIRMGDARRVVFAGAVIVIIGMCAFLSSQPHDPRLTNLGLYLYGYQSPEHIIESTETLFFEEGANANVFVSEQFGVTTLRINGKVDASDEGDMRMQLGLACFPRALRPDAQRALVIGYGSGVTVGASLLYPGAEVVCCEIEPAIVTAGALFAHVNHRTRRNERLDYVLDDGRAFLQGENETFDLILSEPSNPWISGMSNLFTVEFYREASQRLRPGGVFAQWIQTYEFAFEDYALILRTLMEAFDHALMIRISDGDSILLTSNQPLTLDRDLLARAQAQIDSVDALRHDLETYFGRSDITSLLLEHAWRDREGLFTWANAAEDASLITDANLRLEFDAPLRVFEDRPREAMLDYVLVKDLDPQALIQRFEQWGGDTGDVHALYEWIARLIQYDEPAKANALTEFGLTIAPQDVQLRAYQLRSAPPDSAGFSEALSVLLSASPQNAFRAAEDAIKQADHLRANVILSPLTDARPHWATAWAYLAQARANLEQWASAEAALEQAARLDPFNPITLAVIEEYRNARGIRNSSPLAELLEAD